MSVIRGGAPGSRETEKEFSGRKSPSPVAFKKASFLAQQRKKASGLAATGSPV
jgi:hypothetical protein